MLRRASPSIAQARERSTRAGAAAHPGLASAEFPTKHDAMSAEYRFKRLTRDKKDALLAKAAASKEPFERILEEAFAK